MATLYPYQVEGVKFLLQRPAEMNHKPHRLLADEQGLGKTPQAIVAMKECNAKTGLIICPASVKYNWLRKMVEWGLCDESDIYVVRSGGEKIPANVRYIVVNYDLVIIPNIHTQLNLCRFDVLVLDECHRLKAMDAKRSRMVLGKAGIVHRCNRKFLLSGTPVPNRPIEFFIILKTLAPELIRPYEKWVEFGRQFCNGWEDKFGQKDPDTGKAWNFKGASNIADLRQRIAPFMLRRELKDVYKQLPPMVEEVVYLDVKINAHPEVVAQAADSRVARTEDFDPETEMPQATVRRIIGETKVPQVVLYVKDQLEIADRVVVFAYHQNVIAELAREFAFSGYHPVVIKGGITAEQKQQFIDEFIEDDTHRVIILQTVAGGEGIDGLQSVCNTVIFAEQDWSEGGMRQAKSRLHRIGQTKTVFVHHLVADNSLETIMTAVLQRKTNVINQLMEGKTLMSLEQALNRLAAALEAQTLLIGNGTIAATNANAGASEQLDEETEKPTPKKAATGGKASSGKAKSKETTEKDVRDAAKNFMDNLGGTKAQAKALLKEGGFDSLAELIDSGDADKWAEYVKTFNAGPVEDTDEI